MREVPAAHAKPSVAQLRRVALRDPPWLHVRAISVLSAVPTTWNGLGASARHGRPGNEPFDLPLGLREHLVRDAVAAGIRRASAGTVLANCEERHCPALNVHPLERGV